MSCEKSARFYDLFDRKENIEFFYHFASRAGEVLDIGAGTGRIAIPLAERGVKVTGVEPSVAMREIREENNWTCGIKRKDPDHSWKCSIV